MSHFAVAVISDGTKTIEELLAPYQENNMGDCPKEYLAFVDTTDGEREGYETGDREFVIMPDGRRISPFDDEFKVLDESESKRCKTYTYVVPEELERVVIPLTEIYTSFDDYMKDIGEERDPETGKYGYWENPNRKWDWWMVGGRWRGQVKATDGGVAKDDPTPYPNGGYDQAKLGNMIWDRDEAAAKRASDEWRSWVEGEEIEGIDRPRWKKKYYVNQYGDRDGYVLCESTMWWRAVITPDGKWHEVGEMGWFGISSESDRAIVEWAEHFKERFIDPYPPECLLTVVDCHI